MTTSDDMMDTLSGHEYNLDAIKALVALRFSEPERMKTVEIYDAASYIVVLLNACKGLTDRMYNLINRLNNNKPLTTAELDLIMILGRFNKCIENLPPMETRV